jgi:hypothetical protein
MAVAERLRLADRGRGRVALRALAAPGEAAPARPRPVAGECPAAASKARIEEVRRDPPDHDPAQEPILPRARHRVELTAPSDAKPGYHRPMAVDAATLQEQLREIGAQLDWVRDYL